MRHVLRGTSPRVLLKGLARRQSICARLGADEQEWQWQKPRKLKRDLKEISADHCRCPRWDPATVDSRLEALTQLFDDLAACEAAKEKSTGEGKGEIEGKKVLRIVGQCQALDGQETLNR